MPVMLRPGYAYLSIGLAHVPHQRYLIDQGVATTTGITASIPATLALVEAIGGRDRARAVAEELGVHSWNVQHDRALFGLNLGRATEYLLNKPAVWRGERWHIEVEDGADDIALALVADAWSQRYGTARRDWVMQEMEYAGPEAGASVTACAG